MLSIKMLWLRRMSSVKLLQRNSLKAALENGPKFDDFVVGTADNAVQGDFTASNVPGTGRLPKWLKTPIAVGQRYTHLKDTLRDLKLHTVSNIKEAEKHLIWLVCACLTIYSHFIIFLLLFAGL